MHNQFNWRVILLFSCSILMQPNAAVSTAQEFRIETQVYMGDSTTPVSQNLTLFSGQMIYDIKLSDDSSPTPVEVIIYDRRARTFVLLDVSRKIRMNLRQDNLVKMVEGLRKELALDKKTSFLVNDPFAENFEETRNLVELKSDQITYRYTGEKAEDGLLQLAYFEFIDQFSRLNATDPRAFPPFPRLRLNQAIKKYAMIPTRVDIRLNANELIKREMSISTKHTLVNGLSDQDENRIEQAKNYWMSFEPVELGTYRNLDLPSATTNYSEKR